MSVNKVILLGHLGKDPELTYSATGLNIVKFSLATSEKFKDKERTEWHSITAFGKTAELCEKYLKKGKEVYLEGRLQTQEYEKDGVKKYSTNIITDKINFIGGNEKQDSLKTEQENKPAQFELNTQQVHTSGDIPF